MKYGKLPPKELSDCEGFPVFTGYRISGYAKEYLYEAPVLLVVARGVGGTGDVKLSPPQCWVTNLSIVLELDDSQVDQRFMLYRLGQEALKDKLNTGAAQAQITIESLSSYELVIPSLDIQKRAAETLAAYDDLIENNRRRIQLLEESVRLLYREWFVYLRFPGHEHVKVVDGVPEGWERVPLSAIGNDVRDSVKPEQVEPDTPYIGLEHIPRRSITLSNWGKAGDVESNKFRFTERDILFGKIRPYFHKVGFTLTDGIASSDAIVIRANDPVCSCYLLALVSSDQFVSVASKTAKEGSKMPRADWKYMQQSPTLLPARPILLSFNQVLDELLLQLKTLAIHSQKLAEAHDLLLPRLMKGEISV